MLSGPSEVVGFNFLRVEQTVSGVKVIESRYSCLVSTREHSSGVVPSSLVKTLPKKLLNTVHLSRSPVHKLPSG